MAPPEHVTCGESSYRVRRCTDASDAKDIYQLVCEFAEDTGQRDQVTQTPEDLTRDLFQTENPILRVAVAEVENKLEDCWEPVGFVAWHFSYSTFQGKSLYIEDVFVRDGHRRNGFGSMLFGHCVKQAMEAQCCLVGWIVLKWNRPARQMYELFGGRYPDGGDWDVMKLDKQGMEDFMKKHYIPSCEENA